MVSQYKAMHKYFLRDLTRRISNEKNMRKAIIFLCTIALLCCVLPTGLSIVSAKESKQYTAFKNVPKNIQKLFNDVGDTSKLKIVETNDENTIIVEDEQQNGTVKVFGVPVRYTKDNGDTEFIDTSIKDQNIVSATLSGYDHQSQIGTTTFKFSKKPDKGIKVDNAFHLAVYNPEKLKFEKGYAETTEDGDGRMVYPEAFGEYTYIEYINVNTGLKENIVLEKNINKNRFDFLLESKEYVPVLSEDKKTIAVVSKDDPKDVKYTFTSLYVYDSYKSDEIVATDSEVSKTPVYRKDLENNKDTVTESTEQPVRHFTEDNHYEIVALDDKTYRITSVVSKEFLDNPNTVYPVIIDPTFGSTNSNAQDAYVWQNAPSTNYGSLDYLRFGKSGGGEMSAFFKFTTLPTLPDHANITDATLKFTFRSGQTSGANGVCYMVNNVWSESSVTWNNRPYGEWGYTSSHNNFQYYNFYVRPFVEMWYYGGYAYLGVEVTYSTMINDYNSVVSSEGDAARAPTLTYSYSTVPTVSANTDYNGTLDIGSSRWFKFTPTVSGTYVIYAKGSTCTSGALYQGTSWLADNAFGAPPDYNNFQITHKLTAGTTYYIQVSGYTYEDTGSFKLHIFFKQAIIIVPGIMGSELELAENVNGHTAGTLIWPPGFGQITAELLPFITSKMQFLTCDSDGSSTYAVSVRNDDNYGANDQYQKLFDALLEDYGNTHEIVFFAYDWRLSTAVVAIDLMNKIKEYSDVILISHSLGGLVTSHSLINGTVRARVDKNIMIGVPFLGSLEPFILLTYGKSELVSDLLGGNAILRWLYQSSDLRPVFQQYCSNMQSVYELMPNYKFFSFDNRRYLSLTDVHGTTTACNSVLDAKDVMQQLITNFNPMLYDNAMSVDNLPWTTGTVHISSYVDSYYIIGEDILTAKHINYIDADPNKKLGDLNSNDSMEIVYCDAGDGVVLSYSAAINNCFSNKTFFASQKHACLFGDFSDNPEDPENGELTLLYTFTKRLLNGNANTEGLNNIRESNIIPL